VIAELIDWLDAHLGDSGPGSGSGSESGSGSDADSGSGSAPTHDE
jgi:hypothetical protein